VQLDAFSECFLKSKYQLMGCL